MISIVADIASLAEGGHTIHVRGKDSLDNWGLTNGDEFIVDWTGVRVVLYEIVPDPISNATITLAGYADDYTVEVEGLQYKVMPHDIGGTAIDWTDIPESAISRDVLKTDFSYELPVALMDGSYTAQVRGYDQAGNAGLDEDNFTVDTTEPHLAIEVVPLPSSGLSGDVTEKTIYVKGIASDATTGVDFIRFTVRDSQGGVQYVTWSGGQFDYEDPGFSQPITLVTEEWTTITVTAFDYAENSTSEVVLVRYVIPDTTEVIGEGIVGVEGAMVKAASPDSTWIVIPAGGVSRPILISIFRVVEEDIPKVWDQLPDGCLGRTPFGRIFGPEDIVFLKWVEIRMPYYRNVIEQRASFYGENPNEFESRLAIFYWDGMRWNRVSSETPRRQSNENVGYITAQVNHGGLFAIMADYCDYGDEFKLYLTNNPFSPNGDGVKDFVLFKYKLPEAGKVTIKIYDMTGDLVRVLAEDKEQAAGYYHEAKWTGENDFGRYVGTGIYIFKFDFTANGTTETVIKPIGVIK